ncbi:DNA glycosylase [Paraphoma chrysanthemicola]|uniref:Adenine DNA glycosylase n=1 Tax=Paraphoma chrysanthemicola TaxID=798071 RepID=A0A8K0R3D7_9PLEO|nr:DNA glycosylase [Paraphoma chrysanthemicola]
MAPRAKSASTKMSKNAKQIPTKIGFAAPTSPQPTALPPSRAHHASYHYPLLLDERKSCDALLSWFEGVEETRSMPWRKRWIDPKEYMGKEEELGVVLGKRAYEVWVSEVMLQQTRVSTVIPYFNNWISKWPTVQDLANADHEDVLAAWKGLGYYSRATRLHEGAKAMIAKADGASCPLPSKAVELQDFPGIGRYTAGAVSSIAFGEAEPVLDGNVARVLSRQLGLYMDAKDKKASDMLWDEADRLIKHVSDTSNTSATPGQWNQALMELGSTICTPQPKCTECPIQATCRTYKEGKALSAKRQAPTTIPDIEDACTFCEPLDTEELVAAAEVDNNDDTPKVAVKRQKRNVKQSNTLSSYFAIGTPKSTMDTEDEKDSDSKKRKATSPEPNVSASVKSIQTYCALFPKKVAKKKAAEEQSVVCLVELQVAEGHSKWLIEQRPAKGLLASLWQFPQSTLSTPTTTPAQRKASALKYISGLQLGNMDMSKADYVASFDPLVHVFTHIRLTMHAYHFRIACDKAEDVALVHAGPPSRRWVETEAMDQQTLSTGMRKCWDLVAKTI